MYYENFGSLYFFAFNSNMFFLLPGSPAEVSFSLISGSLQIVFEQKHAKDVLRIIKI